MLYRALGLGSRPIACWADAGPVTVVDTVLSLVTTIVSSNKGFLSVNIKIEIKW